MESEQRATEAEIPEARTMLEPDATKLLFGMPLERRRIVEGRRAHALEPQALKVDVRDRQLRLAGESFGFDEEVAHLVDHRLPCPTTGRWCSPRLRPRRIHVGRHAAHRVSGRQKCRSRRLADHDRRRRQIAEEKRARQRPRIEGGFGAQ